MIPFPDGLAWMYEVGRRSAVQLLALSERREVRYGESVKDARRLELGERYLVVECKWKEARWFMKFGWAERRGKEAD